MENNRGLAYFCLGCAAGAVAAVLLTPKSGADTMEYVRRKAEEGTDYLKQGADHIKQRVDEASDAVNDATERGKRAVRYKSENLGAAFEAGKQAYTEAQKATP